ncbi:DUF4345 domain-containing protein [Nocardioides speluncae]|uniref:DUF4345 domain-containing protein n=1 Tax=Nocardioides speluncae TaxID=2670337 RepID=UPI000D689206|nr:DUF4345 domain-containing protein [Nocardioides speluncae]
MSESDVAKPGWPLLLIWVVGVTVVLLGLGYLLAPEWTSEQVTRESFDSDQANSDLRATVGGATVGMGLFFCWCALKPQRIAVGLLASTLVFAGLVVARLIGFAIEGVYAAQLGAFVIEIAGVVLSVLGLRTLAAKGLADPRAAASAEQH